MIYFAAFFCVCRVNDFKKFLIGLKNFRQKLHEFYLFLVQNAYT